MRSIALKFKSAIAVPLLAVRRAVWIGLLIANFLFGNIASASVFSEVDALLHQSQTKFFQVSRDDTGRWTTGHGDSYYAGMISNTAPAFTVANGSLEAAVAPDGSIDVCVFGATFPKPSDWPGGWVSWPRITAGPMKFSISTSGRTDDPSASWALRTSFLMNALPLTEYWSESLDVRVVAYPPVSADGGQRPRALIWGIALRNHSPAALKGELVVSVPETLLIRDAGGQPLAGGRIAFALRPGEGAWVPLTVAAHDNTTALADIGKRESIAWLRETCAYWRRVTGEFSMPGDPFTAELLTRSTVLSLQTAALDDKGNVAGVVSGAYPFQVGDNFRDFYYAILAASERDPDLLRPVIPWFARYAARPADAKFPGGISHSLGNTLNAVMLAGLYYDSTADREFLNSNPELVQTLTGLLEQVIASRKADGPWLFPSRYVSDGKSLGDYHTGSNVCAWRSFKAWARILDECGEDRTTAARYRKIADQIEADLDQHNIIEGPFGRQYIEGTDADGTVPVMIHDGEETDTTLMPFYGYCRRGEPAYENYMRFAASTYNVAFNPETRGIVWESYGPSAKVKPQGWLAAGATFPGYLTALAGCTSRQSLRGKGGYLNEVRRLTDVNGTWWWWPYGTAAKRGQNLHRELFASGWAEGEFSVLLPANFLGLEYDAPRREFHFAPLPAIGDFAWNDFPMGTDHFSVSFRQGAMTFKNSTAHPVKFGALSSPVVEVPAEKTVRLKVKNGGDDE